MEEYVDCIKCGETEDPKVKALPLGFVRIKCGTCGHFVKISKHVFNGSMDVETAQAVYKNYWRRVNTKYRDKVPHSKV